MASHVEERLKQLGFNLPKPRQPAANYVPFVITGNLVYVSGQVSAVAGGEEYRGKLGQDRTLIEGQAATRLCALNVLAQVAAACGGDFDRVRRVVKLGGFINCTPDFKDHPQVLNGASNLMVALFDDAGRHARFAIGVNSLPSDMTAELDAVFEIA